MAKFNPSTKLALEALVEIALYPTSSFTVDALDTGYYGAVSLIQVQKVLLDLPNFKTSEIRQFELSGVYNVYKKDVFEGLVDHFRHVRTEKGELLVNAVKHAIDIDETNSLVPEKKIDSHHPEHAEKVPAPGEKTLSATKEPLATPAGNNQASDKNTRKPDRKPDNKPQTVIKKPADDKGALNEDKPEQSKDKRPAEQTIQENSPEIRVQPQEQQLAQDTPSGRQPWSPPPSRSNNQQPEPSGDDGEERRRGLLPKVQKPAGNLWDNSFLKRIGQRLGNLAKSALRGLSNLASRILPQAGRALSALGRGLMNLGGRLAGQLAGMASRSLAMGLGGVTAAGVGTFLIWGSIVALTLFTIWSLFDSNSECGKPGQILAEKYTNKESYLEGENIEYTIRITYQVKCPHAYADIEVRDNIPANTTYVPGTAKASALQLTGGQFINIDTPTLIDGRLDGNTLVWRVDRVRSDFPALIKFSVTANSNDIWIANQASIAYSTYSSSLIGPSTQTNNFSDATGLLPSSLTPPPANWTEVRALVAGAFNKHPELIDRYKQASEATGISWQLLAGIHFVEKGNGPGPDTSLVSGRVIGQVEPDITPAKCAAGVSGPGVPIPIGNGCGFATQQDSMIYAAKHLAEKIGKTPSTFQEAVTALTRYNGTGNRNCGRVPYEKCPPEFEGEDDPYAMADFDEAHADNKMYLIYCFDGVRCDPHKIFGRPGVMGVVRALIEEGR